MRVGLIARTGQGRNAIGNQLAEKLAFFLDQGADVRVFLQSSACLHPGLTRHVRIVPRPQATGPDFEFYGRGLTVRWNDPYTTPIRP